MSTTNHETDRSPWFDDNLDKLLRAWQLQIRMNRNAHRTEARKLRRRFYLLGGGGTTLGAIVTAVGLSFSQNPSLYVSIAQNIAIGVVSAITGLVTFLGDDGNSSKHFDASNRYQALDFLISNILVIPKDQRDNAIDVLNGIRGQFDDISSSSPMLSFSVCETLQWSYKPTQNNEEVSDTSISEDITTDKNPSNSGNHKVIYDEGCGISIDLDAHTTSIGATLTTQNRMQNELCGIVNRNARYGVLDQMQYQLDRMQHREDM